MSRQSRQKQGHPLSFGIDSNIYEAATPSAVLYTEPSLFELQRTRVFTRSWHWLAGAERVQEPGDALPLMLLEGCLSEPLAVVCDDVGEVKVYSNVCTHRAGLVLTEQCSGLDKLVCPHHGRCFGLDGRFQSMPGFDHAPNPDDDLPELDVEMWGPLLFGSLAATTAFSEWMGPLARQLGPLVASTFEGALPTHEEEQLVGANWALLVEGQLEAMHCQGSHPQMAALWDMSTIDIQVHPFGVVTTVEAPEGAPCFQRGDQRLAMVAAWLFPNFLVEVHPDGIIVRLVEPRDPVTSSIRSTIWSNVDDAEAWLGALEEMREQDAQLAEQQQQGMLSGFYNKGRYAADAERGVHHFHRLLARFMFRE